MHIDDMRDDEFNLCVTAVLFPYSPLLQLSKSP
jgi:hypothetical protein